MARPRKHPEGTSAAEIKRQSRARLGGSSVEISAETRQRLDAMAAPGESRKAVVERLLREAGARL